MKIVLCWWHILKLLSFINAPLGHVKSNTQNLSLIGSAVLTFIGYKHPDRQTNKKKQSIFFVLLEDVTLLGNETFEIKVNPHNLTLITKQEH